MIQFSKFLIEWSSFAACISVFTFIPMGKLIAGLVIVLGGVSIPSRMSLKRRTDAAKSAPGSRERWAVVERNLRFGLVALGIVIIAIAFFQGWDMSSAAVASQRLEMRSRADLAKEAPQSPTAETLTIAGCGLLVVALEARSERIAAGCSGGEAELAEFKTILEARFPRRTDTNPALLSCLSHPVARSVDGFQEALGSARYACAAWERDGRRPFNASIDPQIKEKATQDISRINALLSLRYIEKANADLDAIELAVKQRRQPP